jgi:hypothetical protein
MAPKKAVAASKKASTSIAASKRALSSATAPKKASVPAVTPAALTARPALEKSQICNAEGMQKVCLLVSSETNEWGVTIVKSGAAAPSSLSATEYPFFMHSICAGLVPSFSPFFRAILEHY